MDQLHKIGGAVCHLDTQVALELDGLVESGKEVGRRPFCSLGASEGNLHRLEVPDGPRHNKVHEAELADEVLQLLD